jgi:glucosamine-6-phosphate deaminase
MSSRHGAVELLVAPSEAAFAGLGADVIQGAWDACPEGATILATGSTPIPVFRELVARHACGELGSPECPIVQLDEYVGVEDSDKRSLFAWLDREFLTPLEIDASSVIRFRGTSDDSVQDCLRYEAEVSAAGGLHLAVLGLGPNGHIGFNEPPSGPDARTRVVPLTPESIVSNARYWDGAEVPLEGITAGVDVLLRAEVVVLLVVGAHKREILRLAVAGPESPEVPASYLRRVPRLVIVADDGAAGDLTLEGSVLVGRGTSS